MLKNLSLAHKIIFMVFSLIILSSFSTPSPILDKISKSFGVTCTVFQKMNDRGDMLRIASTVKKLAGNRAIGTYIPANQSDKLLIYT